MAELADASDSKSDAGDSVWVRVPPAAYFHWICENPADSIVMIHDGVRPNITPEVISSNIECAKKNGNAITCTSCFETILVSENHVNPQHVPYRKDTFAAQAPQTFHLGELVEAHETIRKTNPQYLDIVDSCTLFKTLNKPTYMIEGNRGNIKITTIVDLYVLRALIRYKEDVEAFGLVENAKKWQKY